MLAFVYSVAEGPRRLVMFQQTQTKANFPNYQQKHEFKLFNKEKQRAKEDDMSEECILPVHFTK